MKSLLILAAVLVLTAVMPSAEARAVRARGARRARETSPYKRHVDLRRVVGELHSGKQVARDASNCDLNCAKIDELKQAVMELMNEVQCKLEVPTPKPQPEPVPEPSSSGSSYIPRLSSSSDSESWTSDDMIFDSSSSQEWSLFK